MCNCINLFTQSFYIFHLFTNIQPCSFRSFFISLTRVPKKRHHGCTSTLRPVQYVSSYPPQTIFHLYEQTWAHSLFSRNYWLQLTRFWSSNSPLSIGVSPSLLPQPSLSFRLVQKKNSRWFSTNISKQATRKWIKAPLRWLDSVPTSPSMLS